MTVINMKALVKEIKKAGKAQLHWQQTENAHYLSNSYWLVKLQGEAFTNVRPTLLEVFKSGFVQEPKVGETLTLHFKHVDVTTVNLSNIHRPVQTQTGKLTPLVLRQPDIKRDLQLASFGDEIIAINADYSALIAAEETPIFRSGKNGVIYVGELGDIMFVPVSPPKGTTWEREIKNLLSWR